MSLIDELVQIDAEELNYTLKATVQPSGRLTFSQEASRRLKLSEEKSISIFATSTDDLAMTVTEKGAEKAFELKPCQGYCYINFANFLRHKEIDFVNFKCVYEITDSGEELNGLKLYRLVLTKTPRPQNEESPDTPAAQQ